MLILDLIETDIVNYKKACMTVMFPYCSFKCNKEAGRDVCHNSGIASWRPIDMSISDIINRYLNNPLSEAIVMQGLEPFDSFEGLYALVYKFTEKSNDDIVIYTGYTEDEITAKVKDLSNIIEHNRLIIKFGRFIPDRPSVYDEVLGVTLKSDNQYAKVIVDPEKVI